MTTHGVKSIGIDLSPIWYYDDTRIDECIPMNSCSKFKYSHVRNALEKVICIVAKILFWPECMEITDTIGYGWVITPMRLYGIKLRFLTIAAYIQKCRHLIWSLNSSYCYMWILKSDHSIHCLCINSLYPNDATWHQNPGGGLSPIGTKPLLEFREYILMLSHPTL